MPGRRPDPTAIKLLRGNPGKRRLLDQEPRAPEVLPPCPRYLRGDARTAWARIGAELAAMRVMTTADMSGLELLCLAYAEYRHAAEAVQREGSTYWTTTANGRMLRRRPEVAIASDAWRRVRSMLIEFGLTPAARPRVYGAAAPKEKPERMLGRARQGSARFFGKVGAP